MKKTALFVGIFIFGVMCGVLGSGLLLIAMSDPLTPAIKQPTSYRSGCFRSMT